MNSCKGQARAENCTQISVVSALLSIARLHTAEVGARGRCFAHLVEVSSRERSGESEDEPGRHREPVRTMLNGVKVSRMYESC